MAIFDRDPFESLQREMNRLFEDFVDEDDISTPARARRARGPRRQGRQHAGAAPVWMPRIDVNEEDTHFQVVAELPGVQKENVKIDLNEEVLTISGEAQPTGEGDKRRLVQERRVGAFQRRIALPSTVDHSKVEAKMEHGLLCITLPKSQEAQPKRIAVL